MIDIGPKSGPTTRPGFSPSDLASERASTLREAILDSLIIPSNHDRESQIVESYSKTFQWIFRPSPSTISTSSSPSNGSTSIFADWLCRDDCGNGGESSSMFWINGSPGSGKSTLLRHIRESKETMKLLRRWSSGEPITTAAFYLWESGTIAQRSQEGLLRSLLSQLLRRHPRLVPEVFEDLWSRLWTSTTVERVQALTAWHLDDLTSAFIAYFRSNQRRRTFLLIDGLDELEGDQSVIIDLLDRIQACRHIKICVSSRPWDIFRKAFKNISSLRLQDLTAGDMEGFIRGSLQKSAAVASLLTADPETGNRLVEAMLRKADGVFLWVSLAVQALEVESEGMTTLSVLESRLEALPGDLDSFYRYRLIDNSPLKYEMSRLFQLIRARQEVAAFTRDHDTSVMSVWELILASTEYAITEVCELEIAQVDFSHVLKDCEAKSKDVDRLTAGLVRIEMSNEIPLPERSLTYIHRTVKDWLANENVWSDIVELAPDLHPHLAHLTEVILSFKFCLFRPRRARAVSAWWPRIALALTHARYAYNNNIPSSFINGNSTGVDDPTASIASDIYELLNQLNDTLTWYYPLLGLNSYPDPRTDCWARSCFGTLEKRGRTAYDEPFLALAIRFGLTPFVQQYLDSKDYIPRDGKSLLFWSTSYLINRQSSIYPLSDPVIVRLLLAYGHGLDPNHQHAMPPSRSGESETKTKVPKTPWEATLEAVQQAQRRGWIDLGDEDDLTRWTSILGAFLESRADPTVEIKATYKDTKETAVELLGRVSGASDHDPIRDLVALLKNKIACRP